MNISLTPDLDSLVHQKVQTGMYHSASEVIREGLRLLREHDEILNARISKLRRDVDLGVSQIEAGAFSEYGPNDVASIAAETKAAGRQILASKLDQAA